MPAHKILLVEPENFYSNPETAGDNFFQHHSNGNSDVEINFIAKKEFHSLVTKLTGAGIEVNVFQQADNNSTPDAVFPNNWFSTHPDGTLIIYPMFAVNRRLERRLSIIASLKKSYTKFLDLSSHENESGFLEGTGSLVIDHAHKIAYASLSNRTNMNVLVEWSKKMNHDLITFTSVDSKQQIIYHTNVMMCIAEKFAIVCLEAIRDASEKTKVHSSLLNTHEIIAITVNQMNHFCANCLEVENRSGEKFLVMSDNAYENFTKEQLNNIEKYSTIIHSNLKTIETFGGGGVRCMMAELY